MDAEVRPAREVRSLIDYQAVVLGASLYMGRWHQDARAFLTRHHKALYHLPVAIFALGPLSAAEKDRQSSRAQLDRALKTFDWLKPVSIEVFDGAIDPAKLHFPFNHMPKGDARDWTAICAWAALLVTPFRSGQPETSAWAGAR